MFVRCFWKDVKTPCTGKQGVFIYHVTIPTNDMTYDLYIQRFVSDHIIFEG